jgi:hypothetical protein
LGVFQNQILHVLIFPNAETRTFVSITNLLASGREHLADASKNDFEFHIRKD